MARIPLETAQRLAMARAQTATSSTREYLIAAYADVSLPTLRRYRRGDNIRASLRERIERAQREIDAAAKGDGAA